MADQGDPIARIASALERMVPPSHGEPDWMASPGYVWSAHGARPVTAISAFPLDRLKGIDRQKQAVIENIARHACGAAAHDMLLWGARGMGKSALLRAAVVEEQGKGRGNLALVQVDPASIDRLPTLFDAICSVQRAFLLYLDDIAFDHSNDTALRNLRSALEGSIAPRPANVRLAVTSNHRAILARGEFDQADPLHERDRMDDSLALADRFGLRLGFHPCDKETYLAIVAAHAEPFDLVFDTEDALAWSRARGPLSGRSAWQYVTELAGRAGQSL